MRAMASRSSLGGKKLTGKKNAVAMPPANTMSARNSTAARCRSAQRNIGAYMRIR